MFISNFILLNFSFFSALYLKQGNFTLTKEHRLLAFAFYLIWFLSSTMSKKINFRKPRNIKDGLNPFFRSFLYMSFLLFFIIFILKLFFFSRFIILATLLIYLSTEIFAYSIFYLYKWGPNINAVNGNDNPIDVKSDFELFKEKEIFIDLQERQVRESLKIKLKETYLKEQQSPVFTDFFPIKLFDFLNSAIELDGINASDSLMFDANAANNILSILNNKNEFIGNLRKTNDIRRINRFFIAVNQKLIEGGYFLGVVETLEQRLKRKFSRYPKLLRKFFHLIDFIWTRVFPKLPVLKKIYFMIHGKDRRIISKIEILGRLNFCGFKIIKTKEIDNNLYFIVKKTRKPLEVKNPSYGPVLKQKRIGLNGEIIYIYKLRTMYPYSEYLYDFLSGPKKFDHVAKVENDIRITGWGRVMRKYWIDELPMLINLLQGDLKLVGIRPISNALYNTRFPEDFRENKVDIKPGVIPVCYGEMSKSIEDVWESERKYIEKYQKHRLKTDFIYFFKVINNILFHKVRSE